MNTSTSVTHFFDLLWEQPVPELNATAYFYRHKQTGAEVLSLTTSDENKVFGIAFRTPPSDSTGVAHILEHSVLCGSRKYPLKEPFVELIKGSLSTFLNAFTYPDKTCYPVASQNTQDFYNLIDVYLDAVFYPNLTPQIFAQEGWHYELEEVGQPLVYKGVVFNEMKGAYGSPERVLGELAQQSLFPNNTYSVESGGHPRNIPDLTFEQLKQFHGTYYHPSNSRIWFYGDDDPNKRLQIIHEYLRDFKRLDIDSSVPLQARFTEPRRETAPYRVDPSENGAAPRKSQMTVNWMLTENTEPQSILSYIILSHILLGNSAAPLRKVLLDSGLGEDLTGGGYAYDLRQGIFMVGLKGIDFGDADQVERLILDTLAHLADEGLDRATIAASLNTIEFALRENNTGAYPRGLIAMIRALVTWLHDGDPLALLTFEEPLEMIKERIACGERYFEQLIRSALLDNPHRTTTIIKPDPEQGQREKAAEEARLAAAQATMSEADLEEVIAQTHELRRLQETPDPPEALRTIPSLTLNDIPMENKEIPCTHYTFQDVRVLYHELPTSGITYFDLGMNLHMLPPTLLPYATIFARAMFEMGTTSQSHVELSQRIGSRTGGINTSKLTSTINNSSDSAIWLFLRGKAVQDQTSELLAILRDVLLTGKLDDRERFRQIVLKEKAMRETSIVPAGQVMINRRVRSYFTEADWADEQMNGFNYLFFLRQLLETIDTDWPSVLNQIEQVRQLLVNRSGMLGSVTVDEEGWQHFQPQLDAFLAELPISDAASVSWTPDLAPGFEGLTIPAQVNYVGKGANLYKLGYRPHGSAAVITKYLRTTWLWEQVRVKGGAYVGACGFDRLSGVFTFYSYRDPNLLNTLTVYDQAGQFLRERQLDNDEVVRAIIGAISDIDRYMLPDAKGYTSMVRYLVHDNECTRQEMRDQVLGTTVHDFRAFAEVLDQMGKHGTVAVLGASEAIEKANQVFAERGQPLLTPTRVL